MTCTKSLCTALYIQLVTVDEVNALKCYTMLYLVIYEENVCNLSSRLEPPGKCDVVICPEQSQKCLPTKGISAPQK